MEPRGEGIVNYEEADLEMRRGVDFTFLVFRDEATVQTRTQDRLDAFVHTIYGRSA